jgi:hypothetical protein
VPTQTTIHPSKRNRIVIRHLHLSSPLSTRSTLTLWPLTLHISTSPVLVVDILSYLHLNQLHTSTSTSATVTVTAACWLLLAPRHCRTYHFSTFISTLHPPPRPTMLWKFGFGTGSTLDALLSRETPPSVEELLDEQDILAECKAQNNKWVLVFFPPRPTEMIWSSQSQSQSRLISSHWFIQPLFCSRAVSCASASPRHPRISIACTPKLPPPNTPGSLHISCARAASSPC